MDHRGWIAEGGRPFPSVGRGTENGGRSDGVNPSDRPCFSVRQRRIADNGRKGTDGEARMVHEGWSAYVYLNQEDT